MSFQTKIQEEHYLGLQNILEAEPTIKTMVATYDQDLWEILDENNGDTEVHKKFEWRYLKKSRTLATTWFIITQTWIFEKVSWSSENENKMSRKL